MMRWKIGRRCLGALALLFGLIAGYAPQPAEAQVTFSQITNTTGGANWSSSINADGTKIAFTSTLNLTGGNPDGNREIFLWTQGAGITQITNTTWCYNFHPSISADGTRIAFVSDCNLTGGNPYGSRVIFLYRSGSGVTQIFNTTWYNTDYEYSVNADGTRIAFVSNFQIFLWTQGAGLFQITSGVRNWGADPSINADGTRIAFVSAADLTGGNPNRNYQIFLWTQGVGITQITNTTSSSTLLFDPHPSISADGTRIAFVFDNSVTGGNPAYSYALFLWAQSGGIGQLTNYFGFPFDSPSISADGSRIVVRKGDQVFLWTEGAVPPIVEIIDNTSVNFDISISADGTQIAFVSDLNPTGGNPDGNDEIFLATVGTGPPTDDHGNSCSTATTVNVNSTTAGTINSAGDWDYFRVQVPSSGTLTVYTTGSTDTYGYLKNVGCADIASNDDNNGDRNFRIVQSVMAGTYYVAVRHYSSTGTGAYTFAVSFAAELGRPVVLLHGWGGHPGPGTWGQMKDLLEQTLRVPVEYFDTWNGSPMSSETAQDKDIPIEVLAGRLGTQVRNALAQFAPGAKVDIVAHSLGGLVARAWIAGMAVLADAHGTPIASGPAYNGEIRKLITAATPHYGAGGQAWCDLELRLGYLFGCFERQAIQMAYGSPFLWDLHQRWESSSNRPRSSDLLTIVATSDGIVTDPASATLSDSEARYVNKDHMSVDWNPWLGIACGGTDGVVCVDGNHPTFKLVRSFLQNADPADCGSECQSTPPSHGSVLLRFVEQSDPDIPIPVRSLVREEVVTYGLLTISSVDFHEGGQAGTLFGEGFPGSGSYQLTVHGSAFNFLTPQYEDAFPLVTINPGRTTVLQQALTRTADLYTVTLAAGKAVWVAGKDVFELGVQLCCTISTVQSSSHQSFALDALSPSTLIDGYVWVEIPGGGRFFLMPDFTTFTDQRAPVVSSLPIQNFAGSILSMPIPADLPTGTYTFFAVGVLPGTDPFHSANWVTNRAEHSVTLTQ